MTIVIGYAHTSHKNRGKLTWSDKPACSIPGVAKRTIGPALLAMDLRDTKLRHHFLFPISLPPFKWLNVPKFKQISVGKSLLDFFVCPIDEQSVVVICLFSQPLK